MLTKTCKLEIWRKESGIPIFQTSENPILYESVVMDIKKENLSVPGAFILDNVLTAKECQQFIDVSEKMGYQQATVSTGGVGGAMFVRTETRSNQRVFWQSGFETWNPIWERIQSLVPSRLEKKKGEDGPHPDGIWEPSGLNERLRFYRYDGGEHFAPHYDGCFPRSKKEISFVTFILYLNDGFDGGCTTFFLRGKKVAVNPVAGSALLFFHGPHSLSPLHEGSLCKEGRKYVLRSDVMYKKKE